MATEAQIEFYGRLAEERDLEVPADFAGLSVEDASAEIDILLNEVEQGPTTDEQRERIAELTAELGDRRDGKPWNVPEKRGHAAVFIRSLEQWVKGKRYGERKEAARARLAERGVAVSASEVATVQVNTEDDIPF